MILKSIISNNSDYFYIIWKGNWENKEKIQILRRNIKIQTIVKIIKTILIIKRIVVNNADYKNTNDHKIQRITILIMKRSIGLYQVGIERTMKNKIRTMKNDQNNWNSNQSDNEKNF